MTARRRILGVSLSLCVCVCVCMRVCVCVCPGLALLASAPPSGYVRPGMRCLINCKTHHLVSTNRGSVCGSVVVSEGGTATVIRVCPAGLGHVGHRNAV